MIFKGFIFFWGAGGGILLSNGVKCNRLFDLHSTKSAPYPILSVSTLQKQQMVVLYLKAFCSFS